MNERDFLTQQFEGQRRHLQAVAIRILGSTAEADDAVQEAWVRVSRTDTDAVNNVRGWLTTVVARICLDMLRSRRSRGEQPYDAESPQAAAAVSNQRDPDEGMMLESIGLALLVLLDTLTPAERVAFVLHDLFDLTFDEISPVIGRSAVAARQLASRARRRVQGAPATPDRDRAGRQALVEAFLAASKGGDMQALLNLLDPEVVFRADAVAAKMGGESEVHGAQAVAQLFCGRAQAARPALIDSEPGISVVPKDKLLLILALSFEGDRISSIEAVADRENLREMEIVEVEKGGVAGSGCFIP